MFAATTCGDVERHLPNWCPDPGRNATVLNAVGVLDGRGTVSRKRSRR